MKNDKFCFNKGTGLIALVGIVLVGLVLLNQMVTSTKTSTDSRAGYTYTPILTFNALTKAAAEAIVLYPSRAEEIIKLRNEANDAYCLLTAVCPLYAGSTTANFNPSSSGANGGAPNFPPSSSGASGVLSSISTISRNVEDMNAYKIGAKNYYDELQEKIGQREPTAKERQLLAIYSEQATKTNTAHLDALKTSMKVSKDKTLPSNLRPFTYAPIDFKLGAQTSFYTGSLRAISYINNSLALTRTAFNKLNELLKLVYALPPEPAGTTETTVVVPTVDVTVDSNAAPVEVTPVVAATGTCVDSDSFDPPSLGCDICTPSKISSLKTKYGMNRSASYFAAGNFLGQRACYELFTKPVNTSKAKAGQPEIQCSSAICVGCAHKEVPIENCKGVANACLPNTNVLQGIVDKYESGNYAGASRDISATFKLINTQVAKDSPLSSCYLVGGAPRGTAAEQAGYTGQVTGYCGNLQLEKARSAICTCSTFSPAAKNRTCDDAIKLIKVMLTPAP